MIKRIIVCLVILVAFASCAQPEKTGFVNNSELINEYQGKKDIEDKYKLKDEATKRKSDSLGQAYQMEALGLQQKLSKMSEKEQQVAAQPFQQKWQLIEQQMKSDQQKFQNEFQTEIDRCMIDLQFFPDQPAHFRMAATGNRIIISWNGQRVLSCDQPSSISGSRILASTR